MTEFTVDDLMRILRAGAGADERIDLDGADIADAPFADLGYDSLALLELTNRVEREYGIEIPDGAMEHIKTPRQAVDYINTRFAEVQV